MVKYYRISPELGNETRRCALTNSIQYWTRKPNQSNKARYKRHNS